MDILQKENEPVVFLKKKSRKKKVEKKKRVVQWKQVEYIGKIWRDVYKYILIGKRQKTIIFGNMCFLKKNSRKKKERVVQMKTSWIYM